MVKGIAQHFIDKGEPIPNYELVNEPDGRMNVTDLANTFNVVAQALKSVDPSYKLGGLSESWYHPDDMQTFFRIAGQNIGFVSWHQYVEGSGGSKSDQQVVNDAMGVQGQAQSVRAQMRAAGIPDSVPLFLGEYNVDGGDYNDPDNANMVGAVAAAATTYGMVHSNVNFTMGALWDVQNDSAYSVFGRAGDYRINPVGVVLADLTAYMPGNLVQTTMPSNTPGLVGYTTKSGQGFSTALIDTNLSQGYTVDLSRSGLPTTGLYRVEVSPASPQGTRTAVADLSHVSVAAGSVVIITDEAPHGGTELNGTTSTAPASASAATSNPAPTPAATGGSAMTAAGAGTSGSGTGATTTGSGAAAQPAASTGTSTAATAAKADPGSTSPSGSAMQVAAATSATVPPAASTGAGAASTPGSSTKASPASQFSVANGQIIDPNGKAFIARGINVFPGQADAATILKTFPGINAVRVAATPGTDPGAIDSLVQGLTPKGVVVVVEDHSSSGGNPNTSSGQGLASEASWYGGLAGKYQNNPYVWFGTANEPDNTANPAAVPAQEAAIYNAIRGAGSDAMVLLEMRGGFTNDAAQKSASTYAGMRNVAWDTHYYGWVAKQSTDPTTIAKGLQDQIANVQSVKSADGTVPVVIGEYGPSTTGSGSYDANGLQVVQAVDDSGHGTFAWAWSAGTDALTGNGGLTDFGQLVAKHIAAGASTPPSPVAPTTTPNAADPAPSNPAPTSPNPASPGGSTPPAAVGTGADTLVLTLSEDAYKGDARFQLAVDGKAVGPEQSVTALHGKGQGQAFTFKGDWSGAHRFGVTFSNDAWGGSAGVDRNLYVEGAVFDGTTVEGAAALYKNGTVTFGTTPSQPAVPQAGATSQAGVAPAGTGSGGSTTLSGTGSGTAAAGTTPAAASSGSSSTPASVGTGADTLVLDLSETAAQGDAQFTLTVDGKPVGPAQSVTAAHGQGQTEAFTFKGDWSSGSHTAGVSFANPPVGSTADLARSLYLDSATFDGTLVETNMQVTGNGPVTFALAPGATSHVPAGTAGASADTLTVTDKDGSSATVPLIASGSHTDHPASTSTVQQAAGGGTDTVTADSGANAFVASTGSLDVTGGPDAAAYVLHAGSGPLTVEDFDPGKGDTLAVDKALQGALAQAPDGHGGTLLTFGARQGSIDLINHASVGPSAIRFI